MAKAHIDSNKHGVGVLLILLSALSFSFMTAFVAMSRELHLFEQTFFRNLIGLVIAGVFCKRNHVSFYGERKYQPQLFARSLLGLLAVASLFYASRNSLQADVAVVLRTGMFTISLVSVLFLGEKLTKMHIPAMAIAFIGAYIAANPSFDSSFLPLAAAFLSALCDTVCYPLLSFFSGRVHPITVVMHFCTVSTVIAGILMIPHFVMPSPMQMLYLLLIGIFAAAGQLCMTYAYRMAAAGELSVYNQASIIFNAVVGFLLLGEVPPLRTVIGGAMVLAASAALFFSKKKQLHGENTEEKPAETC